MLKKWHGLSTLLLVSFLHVSAQQNLERKSGQLKANITFLGSGANYELRLLKYTTVNFEAGAEMGLSYSNSSYFGSKLGYALLPNFSGEVRQYYGIRRREAKGKRVDNNAGSFFSVTGGYRTRPIISNDYFENDFAYVTPAWGMQRSWGQHFSFEARFGFRFSPVEYSDGAINALDVRVQVGYVIW
jgi:hypothetical protein